MDEIEEVMNEPKKIYAPFSDLFLMKSYHKALEDGKVAIAAKLKQELEARKVVLL